jgi:hypothetical protein
MFKAVTTTGSRACVDSPPWAHAYLSATAVGIGSVELTAERASHQKLGSRPSI